MRQRRWLMSVVLLAFFLKTSLKEVENFVSAAQRPGRQPTAGAQSPDVHLRGATSQSSRLLQTSRRSVQQESKVTQDFGLELSDKDWSLFTLLLAQFPLFLGVGALIPVLPLYGKEFGLSQSSIGLLVSSPSVAKLLLNVPMGRLADTLGRRPLMVIGMLVLALGDIGTGLAVALPALIAGRFVTGAGLSIADAGTGAWIADVTENDPSKRASFLGIQTAIISLAFVLGPALGGMAVDEYGLSSIFYIVAAGAVLCAAGFATLPDQQEAKNKEEVEEPVSFSELMKSKDQQGLAGVSMAFYVGAACKFAVVPGVATEVFGATASEVGQLFSLLAAAGIFGTLAGGSLTGSIGPRLVLGACGATCALAYVVAAFATYIQAKELFVLSLATWALCGAAKSPALQSYAMEVAPSDSRGSALSVPRTAGDLTFLVAPFALGVAADQLGSEVALGLCGAAFAVGTAIFAILSSPMASDLLAAQPQPDSRRAR